MIEETTKGKCPLACFEFNTEDAEKNVKIDYDKGLCYAPATFIKERKESKELAKHTTMYWCAAMDTRFSYLECEIFHRWFWIQVAKHHKLPNEEVTK